MQKDGMMEAVKRRKFVKQHEEDSHGEHAQGQSAMTGDDELAPARGAAGKDVNLGGHPDDSGAPQETRDAAHQGQTKLGMEGFDHVDKSSAPVNSKPMFHDPGKDTHDDADPNMHRNMAGDGSNSKYDKMGVDEHKDVRLQSSDMAKSNMMRGSAGKMAARKMVGDATNVERNPVDHGESVVSGQQNNQQQKGFAAPMSKVNKSGDKGMAWDQDEEGASGGSGLYGADGEEDQQREALKNKGMKGARSRLEGFLSKKKA